MPNGARPTPILPDVIVNCAVYERAASVGVATSPSMTPAQPHGVPTHSYGSGSSNPSADEFKTIAAEFDLHELAVERRAETATSSSSD